MSRLHLRVAILYLGGLQCYDCHKRVNRNTLNYRPFKYPAGTIEMVPVCMEHDRDREKKKKNEATNE